MQKNINIKYRVYKVFFVCVLCAFFFVQSQASFIACAYNDYALNTQAASFQKTHAGRFLLAHAGADTQPKFKLNKRYQPVTSPAILPFVYQLQPPLSSGLQEWPVITPHIFSSFRHNISLRGPPVF